MSGMEIDDENEDSKRCWKIKERLFDSVNIVYNESNSMFMFWNKYQIFAYEDLNFETPAKVFVLEFQVRQIIISNNYLVCLDFAGNVLITSLKFKNSTQLFRGNFQPKVLDILNYRQHASDKILCLKYESEIYYLCLHRINAEFQLEKRVHVLHDEKHWPLPQATQDKCILYSHAINKDDLEVFKEIFKVNDSLRNDYNIVLISFDKVTVYGCLFSSKMPGDDIKLLKLYTSPSEICDIQIIETDNVNMIIGLTIGSIVKLPLKNMPRIPAVIHLNTPIFKFLTTKTNDTIIYADGISMWKAENILSKQEIKFSQFFVNHIKDFIKFGDQLICTTYTKLIYTFPVEDETVYIKPVSTDEYCKAEELLNNSEYYYKIMKELENNNELSKKLSEEGSYITALALSKRQDVMDSVIKHSVVTYNNYEEAIKENPEVTLTEEISKYFETESYFFLIKLTSTIIHHTLNDVLSNLFGDLKIHINISSEQRIVKTTSIKLNEMFKKVQILIPLSNTKMLITTEINVDIKIVTNIPGSLDEKQAIWITLYRKLVVLNSVHFVKMTTVSNKIVSLKQPEETIEDLIFQTACNHHGELFTFTDTAKNKRDATKWSLYVKLPHDYKETLKTEDYYKEQFNTRTAEYFLKQLSSEEFLKSKTNTCFEISNEKVVMEIVSYFSRPLLKVSSSNLEVALNFRNFLADLMHKNFKMYSRGTEFVPYSLYTTIENLQKEIKNCILNGSQEDLSPLLEQFHRTVYGAIPL